MNGVRHRGRGHSSTYMEWNRRDEQNYWGETWLCQKGSNLNASKVWRQEENWWDADMQESYSTHPNCREGSCISCEALWEDSGADNSQWGKKGRDKDDQWLISLRNVAFIFLQLYPENCDIICNNISNCFWVQWVSFPSGSHPTFFVLCFIWWNILPLPKGWSLSWPLNWPEAAEVQAADSSACLNITVSKIKFIYTISDVATSS